MSGERSTPPNGGSTRRIGASTGSVMRRKKRIAGCREWGATQETIAASNNTKQKTSMTR